MRVGGIEPGTLRGRDVSARQVATAPREGRTPLVVAIVSRSPHILIDSVVHGVRVVFGCVSGTSFPKSTRKPHEKYTKGTRKAHESQLPGGLTLASWQLTMFRVEALGFRL